ncbi:pyridoxal phosphate-dependent aminotransferase [Desulfallas thermosapovorans]|uniref:Aspartate aminotransferase n=1 Tax=Desulfallas thermosapovorans DSM 6562 TaxID=1121431 RepID=A0A5S4ZYZ5_9FIRM|nr:pyridoxal phosphate-dependent aminotransferase [Desulfallas thermosapovorans]TYO97986.1 aspartate aminotransferase [Desulfallas thermosapovorans DSM 6562]
MPIAQKIETSLSNSSWIRRMFEEGEKLRKIYGAEKVYDFTLGNPDVEPPEAFHRELRKIAADPVPGMHRYMSNAGYEETRQAIAGVLAEDTGRPVTPGHIVMTCGAGGGLNVVLKTLLNPGEEVIVTTPYFVEYRFYVDNHGGRIKEVPTKADFQLDTAALAEAIGPNTRAIIINSPNNPSGAVYPAETLAELGRLLEQKERELGTPVYLISDEPYAKIVYEGTTVPNVFNYIKNSIIVTSHSKDLALPGERIGYIALNPDIEDSELIFDGLVFCNRTLGFVNAPALIQRLITPLQRQSVDIAAYQEKRDVIYKHLTELGFEVTKPMGAFYFFPRCPIEDDVEFVRRAQKYNLLLVPGSGFGLPGHFRLSYCMDMQVIKRGLPAFTELAREFNLTGK